MARLETLPTEILDEIFSFLPYTSALALSWTCRRLCRDVDPKSVYWTSSSSLETSIDLLILEKWPAHSKHMACCYCHKILPKSSFTLRQTARFEKDRFNSAIMLKIQDNLRQRALKGGRKIYVTKTRRSFGSAAEMDGASQNSPLATELNARLCITCGVREGRYKPGELFHFPLIPQHDEGYHSRPTSASEGKSLPSVGARPSSSSSSSSNTDHPYGTGIVCRKCGEFKHCDEVSEAAERRTCWDCLVAADVQRLSDELKRSDLFSKRGVDVVSA